MVRPVLIYAPPNAPLHLDEGTAVGAEWLDELAMSEDPRSQTRSLAPPSYFYHPGFPTIRFRGPAVALGCSEV
jgi:hypothetical protein